MDRSSAATASISTPTGSFCHLTAEFPEPVVKAFLGDPTPPTKFPFCQSAVAAFLNKHCPCLRPIVVPHCQYICHLIASLPPSRKTHRAFFKFWDIISHRWVRCHAGGYCALTFGRVWAVRETRWFDRMHFCVAKAPLFLHTMQKT